TPAGPGGETITQVHDNIVELGGNRARKRSRSRDRHQQPISHTDLETRVQRAIPQVAARMAQTAYRAEDESALIECFGVVNVRRPAGQTAGRNARRRLGRAGNAGDAAGDQEGRHADGASNMLARSVPNKFWIKDHGFTSKRSVFDQVRALRRTKSS